MAGVTRTGAGISRTGTVRLGGVSPQGTWDPALNDQVVDFDRDAFTRFIASKGYDVVHEKAVLCPNIPGGQVSLSPRDHVIGCTICDGNGYIYVDPCETSMLMQGIRLEQNFYAYGRWDMGRMMVTAEPEILLDYFDRLTLKNGVARFTEHIVRVPDTTKDVLKYSPLCVDYVGWVNRSGILVRFTDGDDFLTSADGTSIEWIGDNQPDAGSFYSIMYRYRPRYVVLDLVHHHRDSTIDGKHYMFPVQAVAKLDFLIRNQSADPQQVVDKNPFEQAP